MEWSGQENTATSADKAVDISAQALEKAKWLKCLHISTNVCFTGSNTFPVSGVGPSLASSSIAPGAVKSGTS